MLAGRDGAMVNNTRPRNGTLAAPLDLNPWICLAMQRSSSPADDRIRVMLVDGSTLLRRCLAALLRRRRRLEIVAEAENGRQALAQAISAQPTIVVVDPVVPEGGPTLIADLCNSLPQCSVIALTDSSDGVTASRALQAGARGYLHKDCEPDALVDAIYRVRDGGLVVAPALASAVVQDLGGGEARGEAPGALTRREVEVLRLVALGHTNQSIARELIVTEHTVKAHLAKILSKLGLENRVQLATYATQRGLSPGAAPVFG